MFLRIREACFFDFQIYPNLITDKFSVLYSLHSGQIILRCSISKRVNLVVVAIASLYY